MPRSTIPVKTKLVKTIMGPYADHDRDHQYEDRMYDDESPAVRGALAKEVLKLQPENIDARLVLAYAIDDLNLRRDLCLEAVRIGNAVWQPALENKVDVTWWYSPGTRPFMRAIHCLGDTHLQLGEQDIARDCFDRLLKLQPSDPQGVRFLLEEMDLATAPAARR